MPVIIFEEPESIIGTNLVVVPPPPPPEDCAVGGDPVDEFSEPCDPMGIIGGVSDLGESVTLGGLTCVPMREFT